METAQIKTEFDQIIAEEMKTNGLSIEQATDVAKVILQESGKFKRTEMLNHSTQNGNSNGNGNAPATEKQKEALKNFRISFPDSISKGEASKLLEEAIEKKNAKKQ